MLWQGCACTHQATHICASLSASAQRAPHARMSLTPHPACGHFVLHPCMHASIPTHLKPTPCTHMTTLKQKLTWVHMLTLTHLGDLNTWTSNRMSKFYFYENYLLILMKVQFCLFRGVDGSSKHLQNGSKCSLRGQEGSRRLKGY